MEQKIHDLMDSLDYEETKLLLKDIDMRIDDKTAQRMTNMVLEKAGIKTRKRILKPRLMVFIAVAAAMAVCLGATYYFGAGEALKTYFQSHGTAPLSQTELKILDDSAKLLNTGISGGGYTVKAKGLISDSDYAYVLVDMCRDGGKPMTGEYRFTSYLRIKDDELNNPIVRYIIPEQLAVSENGNAEFMLQFNPKQLERMPPDFNLEGKDVAIEILNLTEYNQDTDAYEPITQSSWNLDFNFEYTAKAVVFHVDKTISTDYMDFHFQYVQLSPVSLKIGAKATVTGDYYQHDLDIAIIKKDGSVFNQFLSMAVGMRGAADMPEANYVSYFTLERPINIHDIEGISVNGWEIPLN